MDRLRSWIAARPVAGFVLLTFGISYLVGGPVLVAGMATIGPRDELLRTYAPRILVVYGPGLAALIMARAAGAGGPAVLLRRLIPSRSDVGVAAGVLLVNGAAAAIAVRVAGVGWEEMSRTVRANAGLLVAHIALQVTVVAVGEELGWRGWLLPRLAARTSRARAALGTGVIWGVWHAPLLVRGVAVAITFLLFVLGLSVLFTWLWSRARCGLFTVIVAHASVNAPLVFWEQASAGIRGGDEYLRRAWLVFQLMYATAGLVWLVAQPRWWAAREVDAESESSPHVP